MNTNDYTEQKTGHRRSQVHPTAGLVVYDNLNRQAAVITKDGKVSKTDLMRPYEEDITEDSEQ